MNAKIFALILALAATPAALAQGAPTAQQLLQISVFAGGTVTYTGLATGKNAGVTAGFDVGFGRVAGLHPSVELRGTYPVNDGQVDGQKLVVGGLKLDKRLGRVRPYVNVLFGRGEIDYLNGGYPSLDYKYYYVQTPSNVFSPGAGIDFDVSRHFAVKLDGQLEHYNTPVTTSGGLYAKAITLGLVYRLDFGDGHKTRRR